MVKSLKNTRKTANRNVLGIIIAVLGTVCILQLGYIISNNTKNKSHVNFQNFSSEIVSDTSSNSIYVPSEYINYTGKHTETILDIAKDLLTRADGSEPKALKLIRAHWHGAIVSFDGGYAMLSHGLPSPIGQVVDKELIARGNRIDNIAALHSDYRYSDIMKTLRGKREDLIYSAICRYQEGPAKKNDCRKNTQFNIENTIKTENSEFIIGNSYGYPSGTEAHSMTLVFNYRTGQYDEFGHLSIKAPVGSFLKSINAPQDVLKNIFPDETNRQQCTNDSPECEFVKNLNPADYIKKS